MKLAAGAVIVLSAVGVGVMTGLIPGVSSQDKPAQVASQESQAPVASTPAPAKHTQAKSATHVATAEQARERVTTAPACADCGVVESVDTVEVKGQGSGAGAVAGGLAGLVIGNQIGQGKGRTLAKVAGAVGGAYAGNEIEKNMKKTVQYQVAVRMNDGSLRTITLASADGLTAGTRVKVAGDTVVRQ
ncbi:MAG: glycine zipper 2TM domain-containing protein [Sulfurifustaceae bacterium]